MKFLNKYDVYLLFTLSYQSKIFLYTSSRPKLSKAKRSGEISYFCFSKSKCIADTSKKIISYKSL